MRERPNDIPAGEGVYSDTVIDHATRPRNVGTLEGADGVGADGDPVYGNQVRISIRVAAGAVQAARFKAFGCSATIAAASMATTLATGATLSAARAVDAAAIERALGGLPAEKRYCATVAAGALHRALDACQGLSGEG
ncbi:MAG TPA: iron-sulfur cluster assembly scaffold protein [Chloroflexota bacterium]|nr:iron-sulfur cluster assembly scaffold protein [Chloroflexota bacterium]